MDESIAGRVAERLEEDPVLSEALSRGIVNQRALARWMIETYEWEASEDSVVSGLRSYGPDERGDILEDARALLKKAHLNTRANLCSVELAGRGHVEDCIPDLFKAVDTTRGETIRVVSSPKGFKVILDEKNLDLVRKILGDEHIDHVKEGLTEIAVVIPPKGEDTPGVMALVTARLSLRGINIEGFVDGVHEEGYLVDGEDAIKAYEALAELTGSPAMEEP